MKGLFVNYMDLVVALTENRMWRCTFQLSGMEVDGDG